MTDYPRLVVEGRENWVYTHDFGDAQRVTIGRTAANDVELGDMHSSTHHAEVVYENGDYVLHDLGSKNGTLLNGQKIERQILSSGDSIQIGNSTLTFLCDADEENSIAMMAQLINMPAVTPRERVEASERALLPVCENLEKLKASMANQRLDADAQLVFSQGFNDMQSELRRARQTIERLSAVNEFILLLSAKHEPSKLLQAAVKFVAERVEAENGFIMTIDPKMRKCMVRAHYGAIRDWANPPAPNGKQEAPMSLTIVKNALRTAEPVVYQADRPDAELDEAASILALGIESALCFPLLSNGKACGVLYLDIRTMRPFAPGAEELVKELVQHLNSLLYPA